VHWLDFILGDQRVDQQSLTLHHILTHPPKQPKDKSKGKKKDAGITMPSAKSFFLYVCYTFIRVEQWIN